VFVKFVTATLIVRKWQTRIKCSTIWLSVYLRANAMAESPINSNNNNNNNNHLKIIHKISSNLPVKHEIKELQKTAILCTAHVLRSVLM